MYVGATMQLLDNLNALVREVSRSKEDFIKDHFQKYDKPEMLPAWKTLELATFGTFSKLYYNSFRLAGRGIVAIR